MMKKGAPNVPEPTAIALDRMATAVIVLDLSTRCDDPGAPCAELLPEVGKFLERARAAGVSIVFSVSLRDRGTELGVVASTLAPRRSATDGGQEPGDYRRRYERGCHVYCYDGGTGVQVQCGHSRGRRYRVLRLRAGIRPAPAPRSPRRLHHAHPLLHPTCHHFPVAARRSADKQPRVFTGFSLRSLSNATSTLEQVPPKPASPTPLPLHEQQQASSAKNTAHFAPCALLSLLDSYSLSLRPNWLIAES